MKTESEKAGEMARKTATVIVLDPDGKEIRRFDGVSGWVIGITTVDGNMSVDSPLPPEMAAGLLSLMHARYVTIPYLAAINAQARSQEPRVVPVSATGMPPGPAPLNGRPRIVVP